MDIEEQEQKFDQSLDQLSHSTTRLSNTLMCHVTEHSPQLYLKTKLHLLSCIGGLCKAVVKVQQARNKLSFFRQNVGLAWTEKLCSPLLAKDKKGKKSSKRVALLAVPSATEAVSLLEGLCLKAAALSLRPNMLHTLDLLYSFYHCQWRCYSHMYNVIKFRQALLNSLALLVVAVGIIASSIFDILLWPPGEPCSKDGTISRKSPIKVDRCQFAYTTYAKILTELRTYARGIPFDRDSFLVRCRPSTTPLQISHQPSPIDACKSITVVFIT